MHTNKRRRHVLISETAGAVTLTTGPVTPFPVTTDAVEPYLDGNVVQDALTPFTLTYGDSTVTGKVQSVSCKKRRAGPSISTGA